MTQQNNLPFLNLGGYQEAIEEQLALFKQERFLDRLWQKDATLWSADPIQQATILDGLGWLDVAEKMTEAVASLSDFASEVRDAGFLHVVDMGMGGSTLAPLALGRIFPPGDSGIPLTVLDTTDPGTILGLERGLPLSQTLFVVASKSGTTAESAAFGDYFYAKVKERKGSRAGENFVAITDPGTPLVRIAGERGFRKTFLNFADIGGRYSALSYFGLVPAALIGAPFGELLDRALRMKRACAASELSGNPGIVLGAAMGILGRHGRDKVTLILPESLETFGMWLEQLLAESTGKNERGLLPVAGELPLRLTAYGDDRLFVYLRIKSDPATSLDDAVEGLKKAGHPIITLFLNDRLDLGQEFFRWEIATATAGAILGINPFDQPNVQESKDITHRLLEEIKSSGGLPEPASVLSEGSLTFYGPDLAKTGNATLEKFFAQKKPRDYLAIHAYLPEIPSVTETIQTIRLRLRDKLHVATTVGYGPRFLHSTGQYHKGGPNTGLFLQLTTDVTEDTDRIPGAPYTFGTFRMAQALGDLEALHKHHRRALRIHLGADPAAGLAALDRCLKKVLKR